MRLTARNVAALNIPPRKAEHVEWDDELTGFGLRLRQGGKRTWIVQYRVGRQSRESRSAPSRPFRLTLPEALQRPTSQGLNSGPIPRPRKRGKKPALPSPWPPWWTGISENAKSRLKPRSFEEVERHLKKHWAPLHGIPVHKITRAKVAARLEEIERASGPIASNRARSAISALFTHGMRIGVADANPVVGALRVADEVQRDHVLTDDELAAIWRACRDDDYGRIIRLLTLTGQRRDEVGDMTWAEVDLGAALWTIPKERTKNGLAHDIPLSRPAVEILSSVPRREGRQLVFGEGRGGFSGWSQSKRRLDARIAAIGAKVRPWRLHDLRRTVATRMADLGILPHVIEAVLNHISGHKGGVAGIYNRATYAKEKREALNAWTAHVAKLTH